MTGLDDGRLASIRAGFPYLHGRAYLNSGGAGLAWRGQSAAAAVYYDDVASMGADGQRLWMALGVRARERVAALLDVPVKDASFFRNTTEVINLAANSMEWHAGDEVVVAADDFPSVVWPWVRAEAAGGRVVRVDPGTEPQREDRLLEAITSRTRVLAVSHVNTVTGTRLDLDRLGRACREVDALLVVDGIQALGSLPVDLTYVDVYAAGVFKWLLSGFGTGIGVFRERARDKLTPAYRGYRNKPPSTDFGYADPNYPGLYVLDATLEFLGSVGWPVIHGRVDELTRRTADAIRALGIEPITPADAQAGIVSFRTEDSAAITAELLRAGVHVVEKLGLVRVSPHFYNTTAEVDRFAEALETALAGR
ncbi:aminotransferase class V-fold PLP-dependent enzyme [Microbacterium sp. A93]|uniref:aminotransferase class V-fold PLP-dependent enzyme n=1 Tax=Microbacterium sp. A93 TaxID=3450716 RepID=UPI003F422485